MGKASRKKKETAAPAGPAQAPGRRPEAGGGLGPEAPPELSPPEGAGRWFPRPLLFVLAAAALFRVAYFFQYRANSVFFGTPFLDAWIYDDWARRIAAGEWSPAEPFYFAPGYPYALAILYKFVAASVGAVYVFQFLLGLLNIVLVHRLAANAFGRRAAAWAAVVAALYASFPFLEAKVMSPTLALTLLLLSLTALAAAGSRERGDRGRVPAGAEPHEDERPVRKIAWWRWGIAGLLLGTTSLVRPETLLMGPFVFFWIYWWGAPRGARSRTRGAAAGGPGPVATPAPSPGGWPVTLAAAGALAAGWAIAVSPAAIHNVRAGGGSTLISSQAGITFYQSNNARARGLYVFLSKEGFSGAPEKQAQEEKDLAEKALGRALTRSEASSYWLGKGLDFIKERPGKLIWLLGMKLLRFVGSYEYSTEYIIYVERETVWLLWLPFVPFALIVALAVPAIARGLAPSRPSKGGEPAEPLNATGRLLLLTLAANVATVLVFYVSSRYRLPSAPPLIAFAGATLAWMDESVRRGRRAAFAATAAVAGVIFFLSHFEKDASATIQEANVHYNSGNLWSGRKDHERAVAEYRRAIAMDDSRYEFRFNMANSLRDLGLHADAAEAYGEAARLRPRFFNAHLRRGQMMMEAGDWAGARAAFLKAEEVRAGEFEVQFGLGRAAARLGDRDEAIRRLDRAVEIRPDSQAARAERARL